MDEDKQKQMADDVHLITTPVRIAAEWIKILVFIAVLPIVFIISVADWLLTGTPIMSPDEVWLTKAARYHQETSSAVRCSFAFVAASG
jgi:hypothetical protein